MTSDHAHEIARLEDIGRQRALTMAESVKLENLITPSTRRSVPRNGKPEMPRKPAKPAKPSCVCRFDATKEAWEANAKLSNAWFVEALGRYFANGGRA